MIVAAAAATAMSAAALGVARFLAGRRREGGKLLGDFRGTAMRTFRPLPVGGADEDFAVVFALFAMKFVNRHGMKLFRRGKISSAETSIGKAGSQENLFLDSWFHDSRFAWFTVRAFRDAAGGRGSSGLTPRHWCLQKEISASAIQRGRRKTPRWLCLGDGRERAGCFRKDYRI